MKIRRSSWHSKISNFPGSGKGGDNLCRYFWRGVFKLVVAVVMVSYVCWILYMWLTSGAAIAIVIGVLFVVSCVALPILAIHFLRKRLANPLKCPMETL